MPRQPPQFNAVFCQHCGAIVALAPPGVWRHTTHLTCSQCGCVRTIRAAKQNLVEAQNEGASALAPA